jgi:DJ-1 family protein
MQALVLVANGTEEMEAVTVIDVLRRADIHVTVFSLTGKEVLCSRGIRLIADTIDTPSELFDCIVLPGGMQGAKTFASDERVHQLLKAHEAKLIAVICASPIALEAWKIHNGSRITSHPCVKDQLTSFVYVEESVVVDKMITSRGPGTALEFALAIVERLQGQAIKDKVKAPMMIQ